MKKWVFTVVIVVLTAVIWQAFSIYHGIEANLNHKYASAARKAKNTYHLKKILHVSYYDGTKAYDVVKGVNQKGKKVYVWVPNGKGKLFSEKASQGWSKAKVMQYVKNKLHPKRVISVKLGAEQTIPAWEITYIDQKGNYSFYYLRFDNGEWMRSIHL